MVKYDIKPQRIGTSLQKEPLMENDGPSMHGLFDTQYEFDSNDSLQKNVLGNPQDAWGKINYYYNGGGFNKNSNYQNSGPHSMN